MTFGVWMQLSLAPLFKVDKLHLTDAWRVDATNRTHSCTSRPLYLTEVCCVDATRVLMLTPTAGYTLMTFVV